MEQHGQDGIKKIARLLLLAILTLAALLCSGQRAASARAASPPNESQRPTPQLIVTPIPTHTPQPDDGDGENDEEEEEDGETIWQTIIQTIIFPFEKLAEGVRNALAELFSRTVEAAMEPMKDALDRAVEWLYPQDMIRDIRWKTWGAMAKVAAALMPLALMITVGSAMREGVTSITGYANAREALLNWLIGVGAAAASYFLIEKAIDLSGASSSAIRASMGQAIAEEWNLGDHLLGSIINLIALQTAGPLMQLFLGFFALITMIVVVSSIILALLAREVILLLLVALSPVIFVMGSMRPLRWLSGLWTKAMVVSLMLGPVNYMLLAIAALIAAKANAFSSGLGGAILGMLIGIGVISVLVALNSMIGKLVYGAAIEIAQKAWKSTMGVLQLAAVAAGFAIAPAAAGLLGGGSSAMAAGSAVAGGPIGTGHLGGPASNIGEIGAGFTAEGNISPLVGAFGKSESVSNLTNAIGSAMSSSRNPLIRGFGQWMRIGGAADALKSPPSRIPVPPPNEPVDIAAGLSFASEEFTNRFGGSESTAMAKFGLPEAQARGLIEEGIHVSRNAFAAMEELSIDKGTALRDLGYYRGGDLTGAVAGFGRVTTGRWALRSRSPYTVPRPLVPPSTNIGGHDVQAALDIINGPARAEGSIVATPSMISQLAMTVHQRRIQRGESLRNIVKEATFQKTRGELTSWMRDSYYNLPNRDIAHDLGISLGISRHEDRSSNRS
jgi:hypothetical protein